MNRNSPPNVNSSWSNSEITEKKFPRKFTPTCKVTLTKRLIVHW